MRIHVLGGDPEIAAVIAEAVRSESQELAPGSEPVTPADAVVDLGLSPWALAASADPIAAERDRARLIVDAVPEGARLVRVSLLGAAPEARAWLARAAAAGEGAQAGRAVVLRAGVLVGNLGLVGALRRRVESFRIVPLPALSRIRLEPLDVTDLGAYAVAAATATRQLDPVYDLGCGEMSSGSLLVRDLADNLGVERWIVQLPGFTRWSIARWLSTPALPAIWIDGMLEALPLLMPRRMNAWEHFDVQPVDLRTAFARAAGMEIPLHPGGEGKDALTWKRPQRKGILWTKRH